MWEYKKIIKIFLLIITISISIPSQSIWANNMPMENDTIAEWVIDNSIDKEGIRQVFATHGELKDISNLTLSHNRNIKINKIGYFASDNWANGANKKYWKLSSSTVGYSNIYLNLSSLSTESGPKDFLILLSIDNGNTWTEISNLTSEPLSNFLKGPGSKVFSLTSIADNQENIIIRINMETNDSMTPNEEISSGAINCLANISISGIPIDNEEEPDIPDLPENPVEQDDDTDNPPQDFPNTPEEPSVPEEPFSPKEPTDSNRPSPIIEDDYVEYSKTYYDEDIPKATSITKTKKNQEPPKINAIDSLNSLKKITTTLFFNKFDKPNYKLPINLITILQALWLLY